MKRFLDDDFLLDSKIAIDLYEKLARRQPIIDYHCHLPPDQIADDHRFAIADRDLAEGRSLQVAGDARRRRARALHHRRRRRTGRSSRRGPRPCPHTLRNPLYHWTHLELKFPFGVADKLLGPDTAREIYDHCNALLARGRTSPRRACSSSTTCVVVCSTDDPVDDLEPHRAARAQREGAHQAATRPGGPTRRWRFTTSAVWNDWVDKLGAAVGHARSATSRRSWRRWRSGTTSSTRAAAARRTTAWSASAPRRVHRRARSEAIFAKARAGKAPLADEEIDKFRSALLYDFAVMDHARGWVQQFHLGAMRNNSTRAHAHARARHRLRFDRRLCRRAATLARFLDRLDSTDQLAKTILYNLNPARQRGAGHDDRQLPGRLGAGQDAVRQRLVVPGPARRHGEADERALQHGPAVALRGHAHRLAQLPVVLAPRVLPAAAVQPARATTSSAGLLPDDRALLGKLVEDVCFQQRARTTSASRFSRRGRAIPTPATNP